MAFVLPTSHFPLSWMATSSRLVSSCIQPRTQSKAESGDRFSFQLSAFSFFAAPDVACINAEPQAWFFLRATFPLTDSSRASEVTDSFPLKGRFGGINNIDKHESDRSEDLFRARLSLPPGRRAPTISIGCDPPRQFGGISGGALGVQKASGRAKKNGRALDWLHRKARLVDPVNCRRAKLHRTREL